MDCCPYYMKHAKFICCFLKVCRSSTKKLFPNTLIKEWTSGISGSCHSCLSTSAISWWRTIWIRMPIHTNNFEHFSACHYLSLNSPVIIVSRWPWTHTTTHKHSHRAQSPLLRRFSEKMLRRIVPRQLLQRAKSDGSHLGGITPKLHEDRSSSLDLKGKLAVSDTHIGSIKNR